MRPGDVAPSKPTSAERPRVAFVTFGCRVNQSETDMMRGLAATRCSVVTENADVYVVNGCSVTGLAVKKARQSIHRIQSQSPGAAIVLTGCLADAAAAGLADFPPVDVVAGNAWKANFPSLLGRVLAGERGLLGAPPSRSLDEELSAGPADRVRAVVKVQDGCSGACSYCHAARLRGQARSKSVDAVVLEVARLVAAGFPEIVLAGINLAEYRASDGDLACLLQRLLEVPSLVRLRLASLNVAGVTGALVETYASDRRLARHLHIPLQSADDGVLAAMHRPYTSAGYRAAIKRVRQRLPGMTFGSDVIVGFPGESAAAFAATCRLVEEVGFSNLHVFRFSARRGTEAADLQPVVPESVKRDRADRLARLGFAMRRRLLDARVGSAEDVLIEERRDGCYVGRSDGNLEVTFTSDQPILEAALCRVRITRATETGLEGVHDDQHRAD